MYKAKKQHAEEVSETDQELRIEGCVPCADRLSCAYAHKGYPGWLRERAERTKQDSKTEIHVVRTCRALCSDGKYGYGDALP